MKKNKKSFKSNGFSIYEIVGIIIITSIVSALTTGVIINNNYQTSSGISYSKLMEDENVKEFLNVYASILDGYYEEVDSTEAINSAIEGLTSYLGDKYTKYMDNQEASSLAESLDGKYDGIGISLNINQQRTVYFVADDSPAGQAGMMVGDEIINVNGVDVSEKSNVEITTLIKQSENGSVNLAVKRGSEELSFDLKFASIDDPAINMKIIEENNVKIGYLYISKFSNTLANQVSKALEKFKTESVSSLIVDLRGNGGGYLSAASDVASLFLEKDKVIYTLVGKDATTAYKDETDEKMDIPVMVMIDGASASASEILAGALIDSYGASSLGTKSYGKGKVQQTMSLGNGSLVKYTSSKWLRPNGECVDGLGIEPIYKVELEYVYDEDGNIKEAIDRQLEKAIRLVSGLDTE